MRCLLAALNAKYIHSNLGVYSLKAYGEKQVPGLLVEIGEYTINHQMDQVLQDLYLRRPDFLGFSCYIWNISYVLELGRDLSRLLPHTAIWLGGPEVSWRAEELMAEEPWIAGVMAGEGEATFAELMKVLTEEKGGLKDVDGIVWRRGDTIVRNRPRAPISMDELPFCYDRLEDFKNRIIYYESSRGCPFSCSYCLSSIDKSVRFRSLETVKRELDFFLDHGVPQVKFIDRTFNCKKSHSMAIWNHILRHDNGVTNFHFEISADLLDEEELELLGKMRPGLVQFEIGVQSTNPKTLAAIRRKTDLKRLENAVAAINRAHNIHQHLDLIAGLPHEDYESFRRSFDGVYRMRPEQLQLGFLKVLSGSYMMEAAEEYGLVYRGCPPYEVLRTRWLSYDEVIRLKGVEEMVEVYYNSRQFTETIEALTEEFDGPFRCFEALADYYGRKGLSGMSHSRLARYEILYRFVQEQGFDGAKYRDLLITDLYLRENAKSRPFFAPDLREHKEELRRFYSGRKTRQSIHAEPLEDGRILVFDYNCRDPLTGNAAVREERRENGSRPPHKLESQGIEG
ncbi:B12-binding domain-containing radical SAM protein [Lachnoclostridium sp. An14]|uniref:B12-binding domain-containing radical SAM protein n=1 Tax=Lachnoclostridium sp. An14 TaxID=1965562 RepID=UPI000B38F81F|nr:B12-binding domain-containing radical SAM protein [Lachnoclostridium sp. An14]OUQ16492.1 B12-binding domain-containing radical SAM protein [Lachnoclostridium sp. An14]